MPLHTHAYTPTYLYPSVDMHAIYLLQTNAVAGMVFISFTVMVFLYGNISPIVWHASGSTPDVTHPLTTHIHAACHIIITSCGHTVPSKT